MARKTRMPSGFNNVTMYGTTTIDSAGTLTVDGTSPVVQSETANSVKISYGQVQVGANSVDVVTGLTTIGSAVANVQEPGSTNERANVKFATAFNSPSGLAAGSIRITCVEPDGTAATANASVDWQAVGV